VRKHRLQVLRHDLLLYSLRSVQNVVGPTMSLNTLTHRNTSSEAGPGVGQWTPKRHVIDYTKHMAGLQPQQHRGGKVLSSSANFYSKTSTGHRQ
jgi:hypothetical protein